MNRAVIASLTIASSVLLTGAVAAQTSVTRDICKLLPKAEVKALLGATDAFDRVDPSAWAGKDGYGCSYSGLSIVVHDGGAVTPPANADLVAGLGKVAFVVSGPTSVELRSDVSDLGLSTPYNQIWITRTLDAAGAGAARSGVIAVAKTLIAKMKSVATAQQGPQQPTKQQQYKIGLRDVITVAVWRERQLSGDAVVGPEGKITLPSGEEITALGKTLDELRKDVFAAITKHIQQPDVSVSLKQMASR